MSVDGSNIYFTAKIYGANDLTLKTTYLINLSLDSRSYFQKLTLSKLGKAKLKFM